MKQLKRSNQDSSGRAKPLSRFLLLTLLKEGYFLITNAYGFLVHPYLTLKRIRRDRSQMAIFGSLWLGGWLGILLVAGVGFLIAWFLPHLYWLKKIGYSFAGLGGFCLLLFTIYLFYWLLFWKKNRNE